MSATAFHFEPFTAFSPFSDVGPYRATDYWQLPEGAPVELIKGRFVMSPRPNVLHHYCPANTVTEFTNLYDCNELR
jgi:hypothetical protein